MSNYPLIKAVIPFIIGILCGLYFPFSSPVVSLLPVVFLLFLLYFFAFRQYQFSFLQSKGIYATVLFFILVLLGVGSVQIRNIRFNPTHYQNYMGDENIVKFKIDDMPVEGANTIKIVAQIENLKDSLQQWHQTSGKVILYLQKDSLSLNLNYGDQILTNVSLHEIEAPTNPHQFNYKQYLADKAILYQAYLRTGEWKMYERNNGIGLFATAYNIRKKLLNSLKGSGLDPNESAIAAALLLGWDKEIDASTHHAFASAGITHLLCVSGLHVGIMASIAGYLLFFLGKTRRTKIVRSVIELLVVWLFAFVTGFAPSVQRAAIMFSFVIIGRNMFRKNYSQNTLAASALLLLAVNPFLVRDVGFQLSYSAVLGIISMQPLLKKAVYFRFKPMRMVWDFATVAIVAQIATAPFVLYYFHQFPTYFLITNVVIVPFAAILLESTLAVALFWWIPFVGSVLTLFLSLQVSGMVYFVQHIEKLPMALISNIHFDFAHAILLAAIIILVTFAFTLRNARYVIAALSLVIVFLCYGLHSNITVHAQKTWTVYDFGYKKAGIEFVSGNKAWFVGDFSENGTSVGDYTFQIGNNHIQQKIKKIVEINMADTNCIRSENFYKKGNFIQFEESKILLYNKDISKLQSRFAPQLDYIILLDNPRTNICKLRENYRFKSLIFAANNSKWQTEKWIRECDSLRIPYYSVSQKGAFLKRK